MKWIPVNIILVFVSLLIVVSCCELIVRLFIPVRSVGSSFTVYDPVYGKSLKKNFSTVRNTPEFIMRLSTNSYGFRGKEPPFFPFRPILFLGDSFTMGHGVNDGEEFPALIRDSLAEQYGPHEIPVVNTGMGDNGNGRWIKFLRLEGKSYSPRLIVLQLLENDFWDNVNERLFELSEHNDLMELPVQPISKIRTVQNFVDKVPFINNSYLFGLINQARWLLEQKSSASISSMDKDDLTYRLLEEVISICNSEHWPMLVLIVGIDGQRLKKLQLLLEEEKVLSLRVPGPKDRPDLYYMTDGHWNKKGHSYVAELIMRKLPEYQLVAD